MVMYERYGLDEVKVQKIRFSCDRVYSITCHHCGEVIEGYSFREMRAKLRKHYEEKHRKIVPYFVPTKAIDVSIV
ncbi:MAG: hypothetical protein LM582_08035 [Desulfurococcaceae archaeon]|jgi:hypothetical protein|nr:hypothetical protein [Desulfurococcaceae archaeon]MCC6057930.1 hypothetical protein [Desulfurococcaceae archaeon]